MVNFANFCKQDMVGCYHLHPFPIDRTAPAFFLKLDASGNKVWEKTYGGKPLVDEHYGE